MNNKIIILTLINSNESSVSDVQYLSKSNIFKPSKLNTNQITIENKRFYFTTQTAVPRK